MINQINKNAQARMEKSIESLKNELKKLRTGRAQPNLLEHILVDYYGTQMPLNQVSNISVADARTLTITPWEKSMVSVIEKAILNSDLGLNPATSGEMIRVPLPPLTEERRKELIRVVRGEVENARIAIRNIRRDANGEIKELFKLKKISEDDERRAQESIQKLTDKFVVEIEKIFSDKEADLIKI